MTSSTVPSPVQFKTGSSPIPLLSILKNKPPKASILRGDFSKVKSPSLRGRDEHCHRRAHSPAWVPAWGLRSTCDVAFIRTLPGSGWNPRTRKGNRPVCQRQHRSQQAEHSVALLTSNPSSPEHQDTVPSAVPVPADVVLGVNPTQGTSGAPDSSPQPPLTHVLLCIQT